MSKNVEIDFGSDDSHLTSGGNELNEYLIQRESQSANSGISGFLTNVGSNVKKYLPRRNFGTGSIEDDIAIRFGIGVGNNNNANNGSTIGQKKSWIPTLNRKERIIGFFIFLMLGILFFTLSGFYIPVLIFKARKFCIFFSLGSIFCFASLSMLWGFGTFLHHLISPGRMVFTLMYFGSLFLTLYFAVGLQSTTLTIAGIVFQVISLISFIVSYLPGGIAGMQYLLKFISSSVTRSLPI